MFFCRIAHVLSFIKLIAMKWVSLAHRQSYSKVARKTTLFKVELLIYYAHLTKRLGMDMEDLTELKRQQLAERQALRNANSASILDSMGLVDTSSQSSIGEIQDVEEEVTVNDVPDKCAICNGKGFVKTLFSTAECYACHGTGFDLSNPLAVIKWQMACMKWSKQRINQLRNDLSVAGKSDDELKAESIGRFYEDAKRKD